MEAYVYVLIFFGIFVSIEIFTALRYLAKELNRLKRIKITFRINLIILLSGILMLGTSVLYDVNFFRYSPPVPHSQWKYITIRDFKGLKHPGQTLDGMSDFAFIVHSTVFTKKQDSLNITVYFHPARSYVFNSNIADDGLIIHEMYHFHIGEYWARIARKKVAESKGLSDGDIEAIKIETKNEEMNMQLNYDDETYHSYVRGKQLAWQHRIDSCLEDLKDYEKETILLKGK